MARILTVLLVAFGLCLASFAAAAKQGDDTVHGTARTLDGVVTPGAPEVLIVKGMPRGLVFQLPVSPGFQTSRCQGAWVCEPTLAKRAHGGLTFKADNHGRARITFVMPETFMRANLKTHRKETLVFEPGEGVRIQANGFKGKVTGIAVAKARVSG